MTLGQLLFIVGLALLLAIEKHKPAKAIAIYAMLALTGGGKRRTSPGSAAIAQPCEWPFCEKHGFRSGIFDAPARYCYRHDFMSSMAWALILVVPILACCAAVIVYFESF